MASFLYFGIRMRAAVAMHRLPGPHSLLTCHLAILHNPHFASLFIYEMEILLQGIKTAHKHQMPSWCYGGRGLYGLSYSLC